MPETRRKSNPIFREGGVRLFPEAGRPVAQVPGTRGSTRGTLGNRVAGSVRPVARAGAC
jgi:hypothetical protein